MNAGTSPSPEHSLCAERERLTDDYDAAVNEYSRTVNYLRHQIGVLPKPDYERLRALCEKTRLRSEQCRLALEEHIAEHGC